MNTRAQSLVDRLVGHVGLPRLAFGLAVAYTVRRFVESMLFGLTAGDPLTYAGVAAALVAVTLLASLLPAQRAARVDPMVALRAE